MKKISNAETSNRKKKILFIGASKFGLQCLGTILKEKDFNVCGVITNEKQFMISYSKTPITNVLYTDIAGFCHTRKISCYVMKENMHEKALLQYVQEKFPDLIMVVGWYHMIPKEIRQIPCLGTLGFHASKLPLYRGGAPLVWAIIQGETSVGISLFFLEDGVDTGDIVAQHAIPIKMKDTIKTVYEKVENAGICILENEFPDFLAGKIKPARQIILREMPMVWPQRSPKDGYIYWNMMTPFLLYNFIRAQTKPYPGAFSYLGTDKVTIWKAILYSYEYNDYRAGEIIKIINIKDAVGILIAVAQEDVPLLVQEISVNDKLLDSEIMIDYFEEKIANGFMVLT